MHNYLRNQPQETINFFPLSVLLPLINSFQNAVTHVPLSPSVPLPPCAN